jgi:Methyltransferase FkbM domain
MGFGLTLDGVLAKILKLAGRRLVLKIDAEGSEPDIVAGAASLLRGGRVALVIWECGEAFLTGPRRAAMMQMVGFLSACGFRHVRADNGNGRAGAFDLDGGWHGNVFSFASLFAAEAHM